jgi:3-dehydroquinate synthase
VDSSIGGKVGVNHPKGKNLMGAFHPPRAVISDLDALDSLPPRELLSGLYEALKGGVIGDPSLFELFELDVLEFEEIVKKKIAVKARIVSADEREENLRKLLNYGHTIAHGLEAALEYRGITHGEAVAWGMIGANAIAVQRGLLARSESERIEAAILRQNPAAIPDIDRSAVLEATEHDKKNVGRKRVMVFPRRIGECVVVDDVTAQEIAYGIDAALEATRRV